VSEPIIIGPNHGLKMAVKWLGVVFLLAVSVFLMLTQNWASVFRESGVSGAQIRAIQKEVDKIPDTYVRKDALEPRLILIEKNLDQIRQDQRDMLHMLEQISAERARR
jgi:hypothetical protein